MHLLNHVLASLTQSQYAGISPHLVEVRLAAGQTLYAPGDPATALYFPTDAVLSVATVLQDGRSIEAATIGNESVVGVILALSGARAHARTSAQAGGSVLRIAAEPFRRLVTESPSLLELMLARVQMDIAQAEQTVACNALHTATERLARWLLISQDRVGSSAIPLTQEYLAIMLGVQRTTVTAVAQGLKANGVITYSRGRIEIRDRHALENAACECYAACRYAGEDAQAARLVDA